MRRRSRVILAIASALALVFGLATPAFADDATVTIAGVVTDAEGQPISGAWVELTRYNPDHDDKAWAWESVSDEESGDDGGYSFEIDTVSHYRISAYLEEAWAELPEWEDEWGGETDGYRTFTAADVVENTLPPLRLDQVPVAVTGTVTAGGEPVENVWVNAHFWNASDEYWEYAASAGTWNEGSYELRLRPGTYVLEAAGTWLGGGSDFPDPAALDSTNSITVTSGATQTVNFEIAEMPSVSGTVSGVGGPLQEAEVQLYRWNPNWEEWGDEKWLMVDSTYVWDGQGYTFTRVEDGTYTIRAVAPRHAVGIYGGGPAFGDEPTAQNSFEVAGASVTGADLVLERRASTLGKVAGQKLDFCEAHQLYPNDDDSTWEVEIPFNLRYFGNQYSHLFVNNNGNVTFDEPLSQYTPDALDGGQSKPIIAPFFADVDTRDTFESDIVTYGASANGNQFCVNWIDVEPYDGYGSSDRFNSFQLLLTKREGTSGRAAGDFDITFNYDQIQWDQGSVSDVSAVAGYASGTGAVGTFFQLPGSLTSGSFIDGGADALISGRQNSNQDGRYVFEVRNDGHVSTLGSITGKVLLPGGGPAADVYIEVVGGSRAYYTTTNAAGVYTVSGVAAGEYAVRAWPSTDGLIQAGASVRVETGQTAAVADIRFSQPVPLPSGVGISSETFGQATPGQVPTVVPWEPLELSYTGAPGGTAAYKVVGLDGKVIRQGAMSERGAGEYAATIPDLSGASGSAVIEITFTPAGGEAQLITFNVYIDPSGTVVDQWGLAVGGATATLLRAEDPDAEYVAVPDGSDIMSERNRKNPDTTDADGVFGWDVTAAWYKVRVEKSGYTDFTSDAMQVPPERLDLVFQLQGGQEPRLQSKLSGTAKVGSKLTVASPEAIGGEFKVTGYRWYRDGSVISGATGSSYTLSDADAGKKIIGSAVIKRDSLPVDPLHPTANIIEFTSFEAASDPSAVVQRKSEPKPKPVVPSFVDVPKNHKFAKEIGWMASTGLSTGVSQGGKKYYQPKNRVTREAMAAFLYRLNTPKGASAPKGYRAPTVSPFSDVPTSHKFYKEIAWMHQSGLSTGIRQEKGKPKYAPKDGVSREAMAAFMFRMDAPKSYRAPKSSPFADVRPGHKFYTQIAWMYDSKLSTGVKQPSGKPAYQDKAQVSREAMAAFLYRSQN